MTGKKTKQTRGSVSCKLFLFVSLSRQLKIVYKQCSTQRSNVLGWCRAEWKAQSGYSFTSIKISKNVEVVTAMAMALF